MAASLQSADPRARHTAIVLENLGQLRGSMVRLLEQLSRRLLGAQLRACVIDPSGLAVAFLDVYARSLPIASFDHESSLERPRRILLVDDSEENLDFLRSLLESAGHTCRSARSADGACRLLDREQFDLVLLDLVLPDADGFVVGHHLSRLGLSVPIVAISGYLDGWSEGSFAANGIRRRLSKPVRVREVLEAVHES